MGIEAYGFKIVPTDLEGALARAYEMGVRAHLSLLEQTACGKILFNSIRYWKIPVVISPYDGSEGHCNATVSHDHYDQTTGILYPRVLYSPTTMGREGPCWKFLAKINQTNASLPHEVLFHELIHAFRLVTTSAHKQYTYKLSQGALHRYTNDEEFIAVLATNIFISDPSNSNKTGLRANHQTGAALQSDLATSFEFFRSSAFTFRLVEKFCKENPGFTGALAKVSAKFNPIAAYYSNPEKARQMSNNPAARERDVNGYEEKFWETLKRNRNPSVPNVP